MAFVINEEKVGDDILEEEFDAIKDHYLSLGEVVCCDRDEEFQEYARNNVINRVLLTQEATSRYGAPTEEQIDAMVAQLKEEHGGEQNFYDNTGFNPGDEPRIRQKVAATLGVDRLLDEELGPDPDPSDDDLKAHYESTIDRYLTEEAVQVSQIFREPTSHDDAKVAFQELRDVREKLLDGADFFETSKEAGDKPENEIDLGFLKMGETMPEIESIAFSLRPEEISPIVATHFGFHLFKVTDRKPAEPIPFETVRDAVLEHYLHHTRETAINQFIDSLKAKSSIEEVQETEEVAGEA